MSKWYPGKYAIKGAKKVTTSVVKLPGKVVSSVKKVAAEHKKKQFRKHFAKARKNKKKEFEWKGKKYNTKTKEEVIRARPSKPTQKAPILRKPKVTAGKPKAKGRVYPGPKQKQKAVTARKKAKKKPVAKEIWSGKKGGKYW